MLLALACTNWNDPRSPLPYNLDTKSPVGTLPALFALTRFEGAASMGICDVSNELTKIDDKVVCSFNVDLNSAEPIDGVMALNVLVRVGKRIQGDYFNGADGHPVLAGVSLAAEKVVKARTSTSLGTLVVGFENVLRKADEWQRHFGTNEIRLDIEVKSIAKISARSRKT
jgi:hypothetical protein